MFEHLVSKHHQDFVDNQKGRLKFYASFFLLAVFIFTSLMISVNAGPKTAAQSNNPVYHQKLKVSSYDSGASAQFVVNSPHVSIFDFILEADSKLDLETLSFDLTDISDRSWLQDLILYQDQTQLSSAAEIIGQQLVFRFTDYPLAKGKNYFHLSLPKVDASLLGQKARLFFSTADNIKVLDQGKKVPVVGDFPVSSADFVVLDQGQIFAYNNLTQTNISLPAESYSKLADFNLSTQGETVALQNLTLRLENHEQTADFYLASQGKVLATISAEQDLQFILKDAVLLKANEDLNLEVWSNLTSGQYQMYLEQATVKGFISGKNFSLNQHLLLANLSVLDHLLKIDNKTTNQSLAENWNTLFDLYLESLPGESVKIHKLSWSVKSFSAQADVIELWSKDKFLASAQVVNDQVSFLFWNEDLVIDQSLDLQLIAKVKLLGDDAQMHINFLSDQNLISDDNSHNNFLWSVDGILHNSYAMLGLPLTPVILD